MPAKTKTSTTSNLVQALFMVQTADIPLLKDAQNPHFKNTYATFGAIRDALAPHVEAAGLVVTQAPDLSEGKKVLTTVITHVETGEEMRFHTPLILEKVDMQKLGSAVTYARRYALVSIFFLDADEDDDGNAAAGRTKEVVRDASAKRAARESGGEPTVF